MSDPEIECSQSAASLVKIISSTFRRIDLCISNICAWPSSSAVTLSKSSCTSSSRISKSTASAGLKAMVGGGGTLEMLENVLADTSRRAGGSFNGADSEGQDSLPALTPATHEGSQLRW